MPFTKCVMLSILVAVGICSCFPHNRILRNTPKYTIEMQDDELQVITKPRPPEIVFRQKLPPEFDSSALVDLVVTWSQCAEDRLLHDDIKEYLENNDDVPKEIRELLEDALQTLDDEIRKNCPDVFIF